MISIHGDRAMGYVAQFPAKMFNHTALLPSGPIVLALTAEVPIYPIFRCSLRISCLPIITRERIVCARSSESRESDIATGMQQWAEVLEAMIRTYWQQWHAFTPVFAGKGR